MMSERACVAFTLPARASRAKRILPNVQPTHAGFTLAQTADKQGNNLAVNGHVSRGSRQSRFSINDSRLPNSLCKSVVQFFR